MSKLENPELVPKPEDVTYFLHKLHKLTKETGLVIGGCGCCGSPWISRIGLDRYVADTPKCTYHASFTYASEWGNDENGKYGQLNRWLTGADNIIWGEKDEDERT